MYDYRPARTANDRCIPQPKPQTPCHCTMISHGRFGPTARQDSIEHDDWHGGGITCRRGEHRGCMLRECFCRFMICGIQDGACASRRDRSWGGRGSTLLSNRSAANQSGLTSRTFSRRTLANQKIHARSIVSRITSKIIPPSRGSRDLDDRQSVWDGIREPFMQAIYSSRPSIGIARHYSSDSSNVLSEQDSEYEMRRVKSQPDTSASKKEEVLV